MQSPPFPRYLVPSRSNAMNNKLIVGGIFSDVAKAFDGVNHNVWLAELCVYCAVHTVMCSTRTHHGYIRCQNTDYIHINGHNRTITVILAKHCIELPDDGSFVIQNMLEQF